MQAESKMMQAGRLRPKTRVESPIGHQAEQSMTEDGKTEQGMTEQDINSNQTSEKATSIILVKVFWRSSAVVASPVRIWSLTVQMQRAFLPARAAFI